MRLYRVLIIAAAGFCLLAGAEIAITRALTGTNAGVQTSGVAAIGGPFQLIDENGRPATQAALAGKPSAIYFGYTYCPDACPTTLTDMSRWIAALGPDADRINFVFVTVDPERDTSKVMKEYLQSFDKHIKGFTGSPQRIAEIAKEYRVYYKKVPSEGGYLMDHSSVIYLMDKNGGYAGLLPYQDKDEEAVAKLKALIADSRNS